jgi:putative aminopeptidase FrvX
MNALSFDVEAMTSFLIGLLEKPSPTGYHVEAAEYVWQAFEELAFPGAVIQQTGKGAVVLFIPGKSDSAPIGITAHMDTLGFMVKEIKSSGALKLTNLGGISWPGAEFENCTIRTHDNRRYRGTILLSNPSTHTNANAQKAERNADTMEVRLDLRVNSRKDTESYGIGVGDFVFVDPRIEVTDTGFIRARFLDDKASVACIYGALAAMKAQGLQPVQDTWIVISNYEEVGHGGASGFPDHLAELLVVDMGALGDGQAGDEFSVSICVKDGGGPYHFEMNNKLRALAAKHAIPCKVDIYLYYSSDGIAYWRAGGGARVGLVGPGVASSHGYERTHKDALLHSAHLLARYMTE